MSKCSIKCGSLIPKENTILNTRKLSDIITYYVKYIGSVEIYTLLQNVDHQTKGWFVKECIKRVCEKIGRKPYTQLKTLKGDILNEISKIPDVTNSGVVVTMSISSCNITLIKADTGDVIIAYDMSNVVFSAHSNVEGSNYFAIVTNDHNNVKICYVLETIHDYVEEIIETIRYAFMYKTTCLNDEIEGNIEIYAPQSISKINDESYDYDDVSRINDQFIQNEVWYHFMLSRRKAEKLLKYDGDFLVRKSKEKNNEHVLSVRTEGIKVHFLLTNYNGVIRTNQYIYDSITHLIRYHYYNIKPIFYYSYVLYLLKPIVKK